MSLTIEYILFCKKVCSEINELWLNKAYGQAFQFIVLCHQFFSNSKEQENKLFLRSIQFRIFHLLRKGTYNEGSKSVNFF